MTAVAGGLSSYSNPSWHSFELQKLFQRLRVEQGVNLESLLDGTGVGVEFLDDPTACVTVGQELAIYVRIANANQNPLLAFEHGQSMGLSQWGLLGQAMLSCSNVLASLQLFVRFSELFSWQIQLQLEEDGAGRWALAMKPTPVDGVTRQFEVESSFAALHTLLAEILVDRVELESLEFEGVMDRQVVSHFQSLGQSSVIAGAGVNRFVVSSLLADRKLPYADPQHLVLLEALCQKHIRALSQEQDLLGAVGHYLKQIPYIPGIEEVAAHFRVSSRTLRRRLKSLGTSFQKILDGYRFEVARELLQDETMSLEAVARTLDYSDVRSFRMAFKRWSGVAPGTYRAAPAAAS